MLLTAFRLEDALPISLKSLPPWCSIPFLIVVALFIAATASAQTGTAALTGDVTDSQNQIIPGATVSLTHVATGATRVTTTDERGAFRISNVQPGVYALKVELAGFKTAIIQRVELQVDSMSKQDVRLEVGGIAETVSVVSEVSCHGVEAG